MARIGFHSRPSSLDERALCYHGKIPISALFSVEFFNFLSRKKERIFAMKIRRLNDKNGKRKYRKPWRKNELKRRKLSNRICFNEIELRWSGRRNKKSAFSITSINLFYMKRCWRCKLRKCIINNSSKMYSIDSMACFFFIRMDGNSIFSTSVCVCVQRGFFEFINLNCWKRGIRISYVSTSSFTVAEKLISSKNQISHGSIA